MADADDRYSRRSFTLDPEADKVLVNVSERFGKPLSEVVCLALLCLEGNHKLMRHALAEPLNALRLTANVLAAKYQSPDDEQLHQTIRKQFTRIESVLAPPRVTPTKKTQASTHGESDANDSTG